MSRLKAAVLALCIASPALAQGTSVAFGAAEHDRNAPVEVSSDKLEVNQNDGTVVFLGNVVVVQEAMRLSADTVRVEYGTAEPREIERLIATGNVTLVSGEEAAEAQEAVYTLADASVVMSGEVLLVQGPSAISGERLVVDLEAGTGVMEGRVRTILRTGDD